MFTLYAGVLNDDFIIKQGDCYTIFYYTYKNEWQNNEHQQTFDTLDEALEWYQEEFAGRVDTETIMDAYALMEAVC